MRLSVEVTLIGRFRGQRDSFLLQRRMYGFVKLRGRKMGGERWDEGTKGQGEVKVRGEKDGGGRARNRGAMGKGRKRDEMEEGLSGRIAKGVGKTCARSRWVEVVPFATVTPALHVSIRLSNFEFQAERARTHWSSQVRTCLRVVHTGRAH